MSVAEQAATDRYAVRAFFKQKQAALEDAQRDGRLARTKLDVKDQAFAALGWGDPHSPPRLERLVEEELDALCMDLRLACTTVQQQVERRRPRWVRVVAFGVGAGVLALAVLAVAGEPNFGVAALVALGAAVLAGWAAR